MVIIVWHGDRISWYKPNNENKQLAEERAQGDTEPANLVCNPADGY